MSPTPNKVIEKYLVDFGLSEKEAAIYLALLEVQSATAQEISRRTRVNRSSTYVILESLKSQGLASVSNDKKVQQYVATAPDILVKIVNDRLNAQEAIREGITNALPELKAIHKDTKQKPRVRVFEGKEGLIAGFEDTLDSVEKLTRVASRVENLYGIIPPDYFPSYIRKRLEKGIKLKGIHPDTPFSQKIVEMAPAMHKGSVLIPEKHFKFPADLAIYDNKIAYMSPENGGFAVIIENAAFAQNMKSIFDMAWEEANRLSKEGKKK